MKPVAWMIIDVDNGKSLQFKENKFSEINIPLYTSPRELSDEDKQKLLAIFLESFALGHRCGRVGDNVTDRFNELEDEFRAILKKASEK
jgi:hypothetical protein